MKRVSEFLLAGIIFLVPSNLFLSFLPEFAYNRGLFIDYLLPKVYLSDLLLIAFIVCFFLWKGAANVKINGEVFKRNILLIFLTGAIIIRQFFVENVVADFEYLGHVLLIGVFGYTLYKTPNFYTNKIVKYAFLVTIVFQSTVGLYQFYFQQSFYGYHFLGEPAIARSIGIIHESFNGVEMALPYGTAAHPNVLAGILVFYMLVIFTYIKSKKKMDRTFFFFTVCALPIVLTTLWFTQSISAFLAFAIGVAVVIMPNSRSRFIASKKFFITISLLALALSPLLLNYFAGKTDHNLSFTRRALLNKAALEIFLQNSFVGIGLNQFTVQLESYSQSSEVVRFVQPAHHVGLLWLAETGLLGLLFLIVAAKKGLERAQHINPVFLAFLPILVLDHYLLTVQSGMLLFTITLFFLREELA